MEHPPTAAEVRAQLDRARHLGAALAAVAGRIAETEERAARIYDELADSHPARAAHLRTEAATARSFAAHERRVAGGGDRTAQPAATSSS